MTVTSAFAVAAIVLNLVAGSPLPPPGPARIDDLMLVRATAGGRLTADFSQVDYFPNLKSKIGFASNLKTEAIAETGTYLDAIGPGLMCGHLEFDHWFKWGAEPVLALSEQTETPGDSGSRPIATDPAPTQWMTSYEQMLGDLNIAMLFQLSGAPAQYQVKRTGKAAPHPAPTDPEAAAAFVGQWVAAENHPYPVLWSLWNEPGHELASVDRRMDVTGTEIMSKESKGDFAAREDNQRGKAAVAIADLFARYQSHMAKTVSAYTRFGLASFIAADFNTQKLTSGGNVFFKGVFDTLAANHPDTPVDFISFNSFNGGWPIFLSGTRAVLASRPDFGPVILSQYAPRSLKVNEDGSATRATGETVATPLEASTDMLTDLAQMQRATDLQHVCMSYWVGADYGFLSAKSSMITRVRYEVIRLFARLPILRTSLDFGGSDLQAQGLQGLAGINSGKAAVLLWNQGDATLTVGLDLAGLPADLAANSGRASLTLITEQSDSPETTRYSGGDLTLPPHAVALVEISGSAADPLERRHPISADDAKTMFLATKSFPDRVAAACGPNESLPKVNGCAANTGTYGFYDAVRGVAYLGMGQGGNPAKVTASYRSLPASLYAAVSAYPAGQVDLTVAFAACGKSVGGASQGGVLVLDLSGVPSDCRVDHPATLTLTMAGVPAGTQAEVYLSSNAADAQGLAAPSVPVPSGALPSVAEGLVVPTFKED